MVHVGGRRLHAAARVVAAHDDVGDHERLDAELEGGHHRVVHVRHLVRHVTDGEHLAEGSRAREGEEVVSAFRLTRGIMLKKGKV